MNILEFVQYSGIQVRTAAGDSVTVNKIVDADSFPIKGTVHHKGSKVSFECEWTADGFPHKLPLTHGLQLSPYVPKTVYEGVDANKFKNAKSYADLVRN